MWVGRCLPYGEGGPYAPLRDLLLRAAAVRTDASREEIRARVTGQLQAILPEGSDEQIAELLRFVGGERMLPAGDDDEPGDRGRDAWRNLLLRMAATAADAARHRGRALGRAGAARADRVGGRRATCGYRSWSCAWRAPSST